MKVLITGGSGFIGTHLTHALLARGDEVTVLDPDPPTLSHPSLSYMPGSVGDRYAWELADGADYVIHLASLVGVHYYLERPEETVGTIIDGTSTIMAACQHYGIPLLMLSTSEAYGKGAQLPMEEDGDLLFGPTHRTRWVYGMAKALSESLALAAHARGELDVRIVRPFNVVGPGQREESQLVFPSFLRAVTRGEPIIVHGDGTQTRTYCHVRDLVRGLLALMATPAASGQVVNLGSRRQVTVRGLAKMFAAEAARHGLEAEIQYVPYQEAFPAGFEDTRERWPSVARAEELIGWDVLALTPVEEIVRETVTLALAERVAVRTHERTQPMNAWR